MRPVITTLFGAILLIGCAHTPKPTPDTGIRLELYEFNLGFTLPTNGWEIVQILPSALDPKENQPLVWIDHNELSTHLVVSVVRRNGTLSEHVDRDIQKYGRLRVLSVRHDASSRRSDVVFEGEPGQLPEYLVSVTYLDLPRLTGKVLEIECSSPPNDHKTVTDAAEALIASIKLIKRKH